VTTNITAGGTSRQTSYVYSPTGILNGINYSGGSGVDYAYDGFERVSSSAVSSGENDILTTAYAYLAAANQNETTTLISALTNSGANWSETLNYTYDALGNIETISEGNTPKAKYYYDGLNQLIREDNAWLGKTVAYTYDNGGNILLVEEYTLTSGALDGLTANNSYSYLYGDSNWKDKLTSYDGKAITYDSIGNRTSYDGYSYTWQAGRELAGISGNGLAATYKYDADGIRTEKTVNGVTTGYTLEGTDVVFETDGTDSIWYSYDGGGSLVSMELNGETYYYEKNLQGDIIGLIDESGTKVVEYIYDSWGQLVSTTGSLADSVGVNNPYRYRGYRYDAETGLYYLQSRYYDPDMKRFINADGYVDTGNSVLSTNMFAYCENDIINGVDYNGEKYNRAKAISYAKKWWNKFNPKYKHYKDAADCANFVSQCLYAGGLSKMTGSGKNGWHANRLRTSNAWGSTSALMSWLKANKLVKSAIIYTKANIDQMKADGVRGLIQQGDVVFFSENGGKSYYHSGLIGWRNKNNIWYFGHTKPRNGYDRTSGFGLVEFLKQRPALDSKYKPMTKLVMILRIK
jgi:RHS repeat-associated protein